MNTPNITAEEINLADLADDDLVSLLADAAPALRRALELERNNGSFNSFIDAE